MNRIEFEGGGAVLGHPTPIFLTLGHKARHTSRNTTTSTERLYSSLLGYSGYS